MKDQTKRNLSKPTSLDTPDRRPTVKGMDTVTGMYEVPQDLMEELEADTQEDHKTVRSSSCGCGHDHGGPDLQDTEA